MTRVGYRQSDFPGLGVVRFQCRRKPRATRLGAVGWNLFSLFDTWPTIGKIKVTLVYLARCNQPQRPITY